VSIRETCAEPVEVFVANLGQKGNQQSLKLVLSLSKYEYQNTLLLKTEDSHPGYAVTVRSK
jgi:hypothetical protein